MSVDSRREAPSGHASSHDGDPLHPAGYETRDAQAGPTLRAGLYILGAMFLTAAILVPLYRLFARSEAREQERPATVIKVAPTPEVVSFPRLVTSEPQVLADFRAQEDQVLRGYGWVDESHGIAHIPVTEALRIVGGRGRLPVFPPVPPAAAGAAAPAAGGPGTSAAPPSGSSGRGGTR